MSELEKLQRIYGILEHIADKGGIAISGSMVQEYNYLKEYIGELIDEQD